MTDKTTELIAEARALKGSGIGIIDRLADALEAEVQHREEWAATGADRWAKYYEDQIDKVKAERDALHAALEDIRSNAIELLDADDDSYDGSLSAVWVVEVASRAIDTKEESNG